MLVVCHAVDASAQFGKDYAPWPVLRGGDTLELPFWGGVNSPKPSLVDFDGDGLIDLMIGEIRGKVCLPAKHGNGIDAFWTPSRIGSAASIRAPGIGSVTSMRMATSICSAMREMDDGILPERIGRAQHRTLTLIKMQVRRF